MRSEGRATCMNTKAYGKNMANTYMNQVSAPSFGCDAFATKAKKRMATKLEKCKGY